MSKEFVLEGSRMTSLAAFFDEIESAFQLPHPCRSLDVLGDALNEDFGGIARGSTIFWRHAKGAERRIGEREFKRIVETIRDYCAGGDQSDYNLQLFLE